MLNIRDAASTSCVIFVLKNGWLVCHLVQVCKDGLIQLLSPRRRSSQQVTPSTSAIVRYMVRSRHHTVLNTISTKYHQSRSLTPPPPATVAGAHCDRLSCIRQDAARTPHAAQQSHMCLTLHPHCLVQLWPMPRAALCATSSCMHSPVCGTNTAWEHHQQQCTAAQCVTCGCTNSRSTRPQGCLACTSDRAPPDVGAAASWRSAELA